MFEEPSRCPHFDTLAIWEAIVINPKVAHGLRKAVRFTEVFVLGALIDTKTTSMSVLCIAIVSDPQLNRRSHLAWSCANAGLKSIKALHSGRCSVQ